MSQEKIETFLTQLKSLDALSLSLIEDLKLSTVKNEALTSENQLLKDELLLLKSELKSELTSAQTEPAQVAPKVKTKPKKIVSKAVDPEAPTLF